MVAMLPTVLLLHGVGESGRRGRISSPTQRHHPLGYMCKAGMPSIRSTFILFLDPREKKLLSIGVKPTSAHMGDICTPWQAFQVISSQSDEIERVKKGMHRSRRESTAMEEETMHKDLLQTYSCTNTAWFLQCL